MNYEMTLELTPGELETLREALEIARENLQGGDEEDEKTASDIKWIEYKINQAGY